MSYLPAMRRSSAPLLPVAVVIVGAAALSGCFTTSADFRSDTEDYIETDVADEIGVEFETVECEAPVSQDVGTAYSCTATDAEGGMWVFDNEISGKNEFTVNVGRSP